MEKDTGKGEEITSENIQKRGIETKVKNKESKNVSYTATSKRNATTLQIN